MTGREIEGESGRADRPLIALFLAAIGLPGVGTFLDLDPSPASAESSPPPPPPRLERPVTADSLGRLAGSSRAYIERGFGFRRSLIRLCNLAEFRLFGRFATRSVAPGEDGWMIYEPEKNLLSSRRFRPEELDRWRAALEWRRDWCRRRGIAHLVVFAPDPPTIDPEILPDFLAAASRPTLLDQLVDRLGEGSDLDVLDLRPAMREGRSLGRLFHRTDTHWNELGAYVGYRAIMARLSGRIPGPGATPAPLESFAIREEEGPGGDMAGMIALRDVFREDEVRLVPRTPRRARAPGGGPLAFETIAVKVRPRVVAERPDPAGLPRAVVFRDSFGSALVPLLAEHFARVVFEWRTLDDGEVPFPVDLIERERPAVVIEEYAERAIGIGPPRNPGP